MSCLELERLRLVSVLRFWRVLFRVRFMVTPLVALLELTLGLGRVVGDSKLRFVKETTRSWFGATVPNPLSLSEALVGRLWS